MGDRPPGARGGPRPVLRRQRRDEGVQLVGLGGQIREQVGQVDHGASGRVGRSGWAGQCRSGPGPRPRGRVRRVGSGVSRAASWRFQVCSRAVRRDESSLSRLATPSPRSRSRVACTASRTPGRRSSTPSSADGEPVHLAADPGLQRHQGVAQLRVGAGGDPEFEGGDEERPGEGRAEQVDHPVQPLRAGRQGLRLDAQLRRPGARPGGPRRR